MSLMNLYYSLTSNDLKTRLDSVDKLIKTLTELQSTVPLVSDWQASCSPDTLYALKRLLRGLPSSRDSARHGFSVALTRVFILFIVIVVVITGFFVCLDCFGIAIFSY